MPHGSGATVVEPGARQEGQVASFPEGGNRGDAFGCHADSFGMRYKTGTYSVLFVVINDCD